MNKIVMAIAGGVLAGTLVTTQVAGPLLAQENSQKANIYQQLDLFGDIFERIRGQYVEEVDAADLIEAAMEIWKERFSMEREVVNGRKLPNFHGRRHSNYSLPKYF